MSESGYDFRLIEVWHWLNNEKRLFQPEIHEKFLRTDFTDKQFDALDPLIKSGIIQNGYYYNKTEYDQQYIQILNNLSNLGYIQKIQTKVYNIRVFYEAYPYIPHIGIDGIVGVKSNYQFQDQYMQLTEDEYSQFIKSYNEFRYQVDLGLHRHIAAIDYEILIEYESLVYEIKERFLDVLCLKFDSNINQYLVDIVKPKLVETVGKKLKSYDLIACSKVNFFDIYSVDQLIDSVEWKKEYTGLLVHNNEVYQLTKRRTNLVSHPNDVNNILVPTFLDDETFSIENVLSRVFEDAFADFLRDNGYVTKTRYKPNYIRPFEIDVYGMNDNRVVICECKLRLKDRSISLHEVERFNDKIKIIKQNEAITPHVAFWFITNTSNLDPEVKDYCYRNDIKLKTAILNTHWRKRSNWRVLHIEEI